MAEAETGFIIVPDLILKEMDVKAGLAYVNGLVTVTTCPAMVQSAEAFVMPWS